MIVKQKFFPVVKNVMLAATAVFSLAQCSEEEVRPATPVADSANVEIAATAVTPSLPSVTLTGINTIYATATDCSTCTYIVPAGSTVVDGKELGLKPGSVVCLNSIYNYGDLELQNFEGTKEQPIVITTVGENLQASSKVEDISVEGSATDIY
ncbi:MAG TPA: hypothetical protein VD927_03055 [Chryseosolibacter sp.]|nr:hypothetical protein [Chryseosolibacter sp.]